MEYLKIRNWDRWQSYRKDRGQPPWIKIHRALLRDWEWMELTDVQRGQLVAIWLLGADHDGAIPASAVAVQKMTHMTETPDLDFFIEHGFIEGDASVTSTRRQDDAPEVGQKQFREETTYVRQTASEPSKPSKPPNGKPKYTQDAQMVVAFLNEKTGKDFQAKNPAGKLTSTGTSVVNLLKAGYTAQEIKTVIARKSRDWGGDATMVAFLRPKTLFAKTNFENYIGECV